MEDQEFAVLQTKEMVDFLGLDCSKCTKNMDYKLYLREQNSEFNKKQANAYKCNRRGN